MPLTVDQALEMAEQALEDGEFEDTVALADQAMAFSPEDPNALHMKGLALAALGEFEAADEALAAVMKQEPHNFTVMLDAADVKIREPGDDRERIEAGLELLKKAERQAKKDEAASIQLELLRGIAQNQLGQFEGALDAFARVLHLDPEHGEAQLERGLALFELGRFPEAKKAFERIAKEFPEDPWPFHYLGLMAERRGEDPEPWFLKARALEPEEFPPAVHLPNEEFETIVARVIAQLPEHAKSALDNATVSVEALPSDEAIKDGLSPTILGVFEGASLAERLDLHGGHSADGPGMEETVRIILFQKNLERFARTREELLEEIRITVLHEVGHLLGLDEDELYERGLD